MKTRENHLEQIQTDNNKNPCSQGVLLTFMNSLIHPKYGISNPEQAAWDTFQQCHNKKSTEKPNLFGPTLK